MKWLCYLLLLANLGLLSWQLSLRPPSSPSSSSSAPEPEPARAHRGVRALARLSEVSAAELRDRLRTTSQLIAEPVASTLPAIAEPHSDPPRGATCTTFGPLTNEEDLQVLQAWLDDKGARTSVGLDERREITLYWVYLPPASDAVSAEDRVLQMQRDGIEDIYLIARGNMANAVSLGMYRRQDTLDRRVELLRGKGYDPVVVPRVRAEKGIWLDALWPGDTEFPARGLDRRFPGAQYSQVPCAEMRFAGDPVISYNPGAAVPPDSAVDVHSSASAIQSGFE